MPRVRSFLVPSLLVLASLGCAKPANTPVGAPPPVVVHDAPEIPTQESDADFEKMPKPQPGDWLHSFPEDGQTFEQYMEDCFNRKSEKRTTIYLQPLHRGGKIDDRYAKTLETMRAYAEIFFGVRCVLRKPKEIPDSAWRENRKQYNSTQIIGWLEEDLPDDALAVAGITDQDLFSGNLNFVFGEGSLRGRRGVYSLCRFGREPEMFLRRALKLLSHEVGHIFSIEHCIWFQCVMSGANSLAEDDRYPAHLCPIDLRKLQWNTGFDRVKRYEALRIFYEANGLTTEADWVRAHLSK